MLEHITSKKMSLHPKYCPGVVMIDLYGLDSKLIVSGKCLEIFLINGLEFSLGNKPFLEQV